MHNICVFTLFQPELLLILFPT